MRTLNFFSKTLAALTVFLWLNASEKEFTGDVYPLKRCPVSGKKLTSKGQPVQKIYKGREIRFCCKGCISVFEKDPQKLSLIHI